MPSPLPRQDRGNLFARTVPWTSTFPDQLAGQLLHQIVSRPAQRSLALRPTSSRGRLGDPFHRRLQRLCCLHRRSDCYRVERTSSRAGLSPAVDQRLSRRTDKGGSISSNPVCAAALCFDLCRNDPTSYPNSDGQGANYGGRFMMRRRFWKRVAHGQFPGCSGVARELVRGADVHNS